MSVSHAILTLINHKHTHIIYVPILTCFFSIARSDISVILVQNWHHGVSKSAKKKIASTGYWTHNTNPTLRIPAPLTTQPPKHLLNRISLNWTWIISGSIEHDFKGVWKFETGMDWQIGWVGKGAGIFIVGLVLWVQYPVEAIIFLLILIPRDVNFVQEWQKCQIWQLRKNSTIFVPILKTQWQIWKHVNVSEMLSHLCSVNL